MQSFALLRNVESFKAGSPADRGGSKHPGQQDPGHSADAVDAEHIERIVVMKRRFSQVQAQKHTRPAIARLASLPDATEVEGS